VCVLHLCAVISTLLSTVLNVSFLFDVCVFLMYVIGLFCLGFCAHFLLAIEFGVSTGVTVSVRGVYPPQRPWCVPPKMAECPPNF